MSEQPATAPETRRLVLRESVEALNGHSIPFLAIGSIAGAVHAGVDWEHENEDIDLFVYEADVEKAAAALEERSFRVEDPGKGWLLKAIRSGVVVDLIFELTGGIRLDEHMLDRAVDAEVAEVPLRVMPAEEYAISQAISASAQTPEHWYHAAATLSRARIDEKWFTARSEWNTDRARALLLFARSSTE